MFTNSYCDGIQSILGSEVEKERYLQYQIEHYRNPKVKEYFDNFLRFANVREKRVVDIGCGLGYLSWKLSQFMNEVVSLDINVHMLRYGKDKEWIYTPVFSSAQKLPISDKSVDAVALIDVIEHLEKPEEALLEARRILKPKGLLLIITPNALYSKILGKPYDPTHIHEYTWFELRKTLSSAGLKIDKLMSSGLPLFGGSLAESVCRVLGRFATPFAYTSFWIQCRK